jgi:alpha-beta hydrolase superfamily lysophospholipase
VKNRREARPKVILLHGLLGHEDTMNDLASRLEERGWPTAKLVYASTKRSIEQVADETLAPAIESEKRSGRRVHIVAHSMGGLVVKHHVHRTRAAGVGRVVMLTPPASGARSMRLLHRLRLADALLGPAAVQLARRAPAPVPWRHCDLGVIAAGGHRSRLLGWYFGEPHDGKLAVSETRVQGMRDFWVADHGHADVLRCPVVAERIDRFLASGRFFNESTERMAA